MLLLLIPVVLPAAADEVITDPEDPEDQEVIGAPATAAASAPASAADAPGVDTAEADGEERIADPEDPVSSVEAAPASAAVGPPAVWSARAQLRLAFDIWHEREPVGAYQAYREDTLELLLQTMARLDYRVRPWLRLKLGGRILYRLTNTRPVDASADDSEMVSQRLHRNELEADFTDLSVGLSSSWIDAHAGLFTVVWGATDLSNPNDVMSARDLRLGPLADLETARLPAFTVALQGEVKAVTLAAYWQPLHVPHRVDLFGSDFALCGPAAPPSLQRLGEIVGQMVDNSVEGSLQRNLLQTSQPEPFLDPVIGARAATRLGDWDVALQYAWLFNRLPRFRAKPNLAVLPLLTGNPGELTDAQLQQVAGWLMQQPSPVEGTYRRLHHAGISLSGALGPVAVNLDLAYQSLQSALLGGNKPLVSDGDDGWFTASVDSQSVAYTAGVTHVRGETFLLTVEWWHVMMIDLMGRYTGPQLLFGRPQQGGLAALARYRLSSINLAFQLMVRSDLINPSVVICPQATYRYGDHLGVVAGANLFEGVYNSLAGKLSQNDQVFIGLEGYL
jgi:hypothetical protein